MKKVEEVVRRIGERIERFHSAGILENEEARTLETLREELYDEAITNPKAIDKLKAMDTLLEMAEKHKKPAILSKDDYSDILLLLRTIDPSIRPSGDAFLEVHTREPRSVFPEAYKPGIVPLHEEELREINHETLGKFVRRIRRFREELDENELRREALRILTELATHRPFNIKADEERKVENVLVITPWGAGVAEIGTSHSPVQPYYPSDNVFRVLEAIHRGGEQILRAIFSGGMTPWQAERLLTMAEVADETMGPWRELFETYRQMKKKRISPGKKMGKTKEEDPHKLSLEGFLRFQAKIIADNIKTFSQVRDIHQEDALKLFLSAIGKSIIAHHADRLLKELQERSQKVSSKKQRKELEDEINRRLGEITKEVLEYLDKLHQYTLEELNRKE